MVTALGCFLSALLAAAAAGKLPEAEVNVEVLHRPFLCRRKTKYGDMLLVHQEGYFQNGTMFHSRWVYPARLRRTLFDHVVARVTLKVCVFDAKRRKQAFPTDKTDKS